MCVTLFSKCLFSSLSYDMANLVNMTTVSEYINEWRKNLLHFLNNWYTPLTFALDSLIRTLQWVILLSLSLMKIEEYAISFSYSLWFPEHCSAELFNNRSQDNTSPCAFTSLVLLSQPQPTPPPQVCCVPLCGILAPLSALNFLSRPAASLVCGILSASGHSHSQWYQLYFLFALPTLE